jgi:mannose-6-phosphate isomerase-like protein (cupin superfamily)
MVIHRKEDNIRIMKLTKYYIFLFFALVCLPLLNAQDEEFLMRSLDSVCIVPSEISTETANYRALFGEGDNNSHIIQGINRFGQLTIEPGGKSQVVSYECEEQICYILTGTGILQYGDQSIPISKNDFMYIPVGMEYGFSNPRESELKIMVMGYLIPPDREIEPTEKLNLASADEVELLVLGQHGPTTKFKLLLGTTRSRRDRIAAAYQVNSLFIMDFAAGGTNIPHRHEREEEIYFVLKGHGEMVAGETAGGETRYPANEGDAFFFSRNTLIGFYSGGKEGEAHAQIIAVRSKYPILEPAPSQ